MAVRAYGLNDVDFIFGPVIAEGYQDGDSVSVEYNEDGFAFSPNGDGGGTRTANTNKSAKVTLTLAQSSPTNDLLSVLHNADNAAGASVLTLLIKDQNGTSLHKAETAWIVRMPTSGYGKEVGTREWVFETDFMVSNVGSNNEAGA